MARPPVVRVSCTELSGLPWWASSVKTLSRLPGAISGGSASPSLPGSLLFTVFGFGREGLQKRRVGEPVDQHVLALRLAQHRLQISPCWSGRASRRSPAECAAGRSSAWPAWRAIASPPPAPPRHRPARAASAGRRRGCRELVVNSRRVRTSSLKVTSAVSPRSPASRSVKRMPLEPSLSRMAAELAEVCTATTSEMGLNDSSTCIGWRTPLS